MVISALPRHPRGWCRIGQPRRERTDDPARAAERIRHRRRVRRGGGSAMTAQQDEASIRRGYDAFNRGDLATLSEVIAEDAVWHPAGTHRLAGEKRGREAIFAYFGALGAAGVHVELHDVVAGERHAAGMHTTVGQQGGKQIRARVALVFHMRDGRIVEAWEQMDDTSVWDAYLG